MTPGLESAEQVWQWQGRADSQKPCDVGPVGHGCVFDAGTYKIQWYDGDQLSFDIYRALDMDTQASAVEEAEDEEVKYGEDLYGSDEMNDDDDYI